MSGKVRSDTHKWGEGWWRNKLCNLETIYFVPCGRFEILSLRQRVPKASVGDVTSGFWAATWVALLYPILLRCQQKFRVRSWFWSLNCSLSVRRSSSGIRYSQCPQFRINPCGSSQAGFKCTLFQQGSRKDFPCPCWRLWMNGKRGGKRGRLNEAFAKRAGPPFSLLPYAQWAVTCF